MIQSEFNPEDDPSRPKVGAKIVVGGKTLVIRKVEAWLATRIISMTMASQEPDKMGHDEVLTLQHPTRPFVTWVCWADQGDQKMPLVMDMLREKCPKCGKGRMAEASLFDDWNGMVTCSRCEHRTRRYKRTRRKK